MRLTPFLLGLIVLLSSCALEHPDDDESGDASVYALEPPSGAVARYRADHCQAESGGGVRCDDLSTRGHVASALSAADAPRIEPEMFAGQPALVYKDGQALQFGDSNRSLGSKFTIAVVARHYDRSVVPLSLSGGAGVSAAITAGAAVDGAINFSGAGAASVKWELSGYVCAGRGERALGEGESYIAIGIGSSSELSLLVNGEKASTQVIGSFELYLNGKLGGGVLGASGDALAVAEAIIYDRTLTPAELERLYGYVGLRYGITISKCPDGAPRCGDGVIGPGEACDTASSSACARDCSEASGLVPCASRGQCGAAQACPTAPNGEAFEADPQRSFCIPVDMCLTSPAPACGDTTAVCGSCGSCVPDCASKECGDDPADGCGGFCYGLCRPGQTGCTRDTDCQAGDVCGQGNGGRFGTGNSQASNACWPAACEDNDPRRIDCASISSPCGMCDPTLADTCFDGPLCDGPEEEDCAAGTSSNAVGGCVGEVAQGVVPPIDVEASGSATVGALPGRFEVSRNGSARYLVPISVPPGRAGLEPQLALSYDSVSGNGMIGLGWSMHGLSTISLCSKTRAQNVVLDGYPEFCLDGQQLVPVAFENGRTEWRTEFESFARVFANGDFFNPGPQQGEVDVTPTIFTVQRKDGTTWNYGEQASAKLDGQVFLGNDDRFTKTRTWAVTSIQDRAGNRIEIRYAAFSRRIGPLGVLGRVQVELVPRWIGYNFAGRAEDDAVNEIVFDYDGNAKPSLQSPSRPDRLYGYAFGHPVQQTRRLRKISIRAQGEEVRNYHLNYEVSANELSLVQSIDECAVSEGRGEICRPPTEFEYEPVDLNPQASVAGPNGAGQWLVLDWNTDGYDDVANFVSGGWAVYLGSASGLATQVASTFAAARPVESLSAAGFATQSALVVDVDGDSKDDVLVLARDENNRVVLERFRDGAPAEQLALEWAGGNPRKNGDFVALDADADGLDDLIYCSGDDHRWYLYKNGPGGFSSPLEIANSSGFCQEAAVGTQADGREYLIFRKKNEYYAAWLPTTNSNPATGPIGVDISANDMRLQTSLDVNGDGLLDLLFTSRRQDKTRYELRLSVGHPQETWRYGASGESATLVSAKFLGSVDYDLDGRADTIAGANVGSGTTWTIYRGIDLQAQPIPLATVPQGNAEPVLLDANGDGRTDYFGGGRVLLGRTPKANLLNKIRIRNHVADVPDEIAVSYATGVAVGTFSPASVAGCTTGSAAYCPRRLLMPVVSRYERTAYQQVVGVAIPTQVSSGTYSYGGALVDRRGRGWVGFASRDYDLVNEEGVSNRHLREEYFLGVPENRGALDYYYPFADQPIRVVTSWPVPQNELTGAASVVGTYEVTRAPEPRQSDRFRPFVVITHEQHQHSEGAPVDALTVDRDYDKYGNLEYERGAWAEGSGWLRQLDYSYQGDPSRIASWQVDLVSEDLRVDQAVSATGGEIITNSKAFLYDGRGLLSRIIERPTDPEGLQTDLVRDDVRNNVRLVAQRRQGSAGDERIWEYEYDGLAGVYPIETVNPEGHRDSYDWSYGDGLQRRHTDANQVVVRTQYDGFGRLVEEDRETAGIVTRFGYAPAARSGSELVANNAVLTVTTQTQSRGSSSVFVRSTSFDTAARVTTESTQAFSFAGQTRVLREYDYDLLGRLRQRSRPHLPGDRSQGFESFEYDGLGRLTVARTADERQRTIAYASSATSTTQFEIPGVRRYELVVAPNGLKTWGAYDSAGNLLQTRDDAGSSMTYAYGAANFRLSATDASGNVTTWTPDPWGRLVRSSDPDTGTHEYTYTPWSELRTHLHNGEPHAFGYDRLGRVTSQVDSDGEVRWTWDSISDELGLDTRYGELMASASADGHRDRYSYHGPAGALDVVSRQVGGSVPTTLSAQFEYDAFLRPAVVHYPGSAPFAAQYRYDDVGNGELVRVENANDTREVFWDLRSVHQGLVPRTVAIGDGTLLTNTYNDRAGWLDALQVTADGGTGAHLLHFVLDHDASGNVSGLRRLHDPTETEKAVYSYDSLDRLRQVTRGSGPSAAVLASFEYTPTGKLKVKSGMGTFTYGDPGQPDTGAQRLPHAVRSVADPSVGTHSYEYDAAFGRMTQRTGPTVPTGQQTFGYSAQGKLRTVTDAEAGQVRFEYDSQGERARRIDAEGELTAYLGGLYEVELNPDGSPRLETRRIVVHGKAIAELQRTADGNVAKHYLHRDHLGSVALIVDGVTPRVLARPTTDVFGASVDGGDPDLTSLGFTGHRRDAELGLIDMIGRFYDPSLGRFITPDPFIPEPNFSQSYDRYQYVYNNPLTFTDPTGFYADGGASIVGGVAVAVVAVVAIVSWAKAGNLDDFKKFFKDSKINPKNWGHRRDKGKAPSVPDRAAATGPNGASAPPLAASGAIAPAGPASLPTPAAAGGSWFGNPASPTAPRGGGDPLVYVGAPVLDVGETLTPNWTWLLPAVAKLPSVAMVVDAAASGIGRIVGSATTRLLGTAARGTGAFLEGAEGGAGLGKLAGKSINVSEKGLGIVEGHLEQFGNVPQNTAMIDRLRGALLEGRAISGADASFYMHELSEATMMGRGLSYGAAHAGALQKYGVSPFSVYHPEVIQQFSSSFNSNWARFWGL